MRGIFPVVVTAMCLMIASESLTQTRCSTFAGVTTCQNNNCTTARASTDGGTTTIQGTDGTNRCPLFFGWTKTIQWSGRNQFVHTRSAS